MNATTITNGWALEVVRGRDVGRRYAIQGNDVVLGNELAGAAGIDLSDQEAGSPRRMAAQQARLECRHHELLLSDLDSPGGTFVNRQRLLAGQARPLREGDLIQVGGVQLRLIAGGTVPAPDILRVPPLGGGNEGGSGRLSPQPPPTPPSQGGEKDMPAGRRGGVQREVSKSALQLKLQAGPVCRSWDDFLTVSAQRWADLRNELTSGRLAAALRVSGHAALAPDPNEPGTPDERLDAWLARIPATRPAHPELDVHPASLAVRAPAGGGTTRRKVQLSNTGYRLLRATARVEPAGTSWLRLAPEVAGKPIIAIETTDLPLEVVVPETLDRPLSASVIVESNGGTRSVAVTLEPPAALDAIPQAAPARPRAAHRSVSASLAAQPAAARLVGWPAIAIVGRLLLGLLGGSAGPPTSAGPALAGLAVALALIGVVAGAFVARRRGALSDVPAGALAGAICGMIVAALVVAACRAVEQPVALLVGTSLAAATVTWGLLAVGAATLSLLVLPHRRAGEATP